MRRILGILHGRQTELADVAGAGTTARVLAGAPENGEEDGGQDCYDGYND